MRLTPFALYIVTAFNFICMQPRSSWCCAWFYWVDGVGEGVSCVELYILQGYWKRPNTRWKLEKERWRKREREREVALREVEGKVRKGENWISNYLKFVKTRQRRGYLHTSPHLAYLTYPPVCFIDGVHFKTKSANLLWNFYLWSGEGGICKIKN